MNSSTIIPQDTYRTILETMPIATVDLVVISPDKSQVLLLMRKNKPAQGEYYTPGGRIIKNETMINAAIRQAKDELGVTIDSQDLRFAGVIDEIFPDSSQINISAHCLNIFYAVVLSQTTVLILDDQHSDNKWFKVTDSRLHPYIREKIKQALRVL